MRAPDAIGVAGILEPMAPRSRFDVDYYRALAVSPEATEDEIRKAYRQLALRWHPDRNQQDPTASDRFKEISEAYAILIDPAKRREYDLVRKHGTAGDFRPNRDTVFRDLFADPRASAVFEELAREFERMGMRVDRHTFHQTLFGGRTVVTGAVVVVSPLMPVLALFRLFRAAVRATAAPSMPPRAPETLPEAAGLVGRFVRVGRRLLGLSATTATAVGTASDRDITVPLHLTAAEARAGGARRVTLAAGQRGHDVLVRIPPGIRAGTRLRLRGKGRGVPGGPPGDAYLAVEIVEPS
jgi:curved DNA-binding protein CbpA